MKQNITQRVSPAAKSQRTPVPQGRVITARPSSAPILQNPGEILESPGRGYASTSVPISPGIGTRSATPKPMALSATDDPPKRPVAPGLPPLAPRPEPTERLHTPANGVPFVNPCKTDKL